MLFLVVAAVASLRWAEREGAFSSGSLPSLLTERVPEGQQLVRQHCSTCHKPVSASALDKETWLTGVLPAMAPKVGIGKYGGEYYPIASDSTGVSISVADWMKIVEYFRTEAPDTISAPEPPASLRTDLPLFSVRTPRLKSRRRAATAMVVVDSSTHHLYSSDVVAENIYRWDSNLEHGAIVQSGLLGVDARFLEDSTGDRSTGDRLGVFTSIGTRMAPINIADGEVREVHLGTDLSRVIASDLPRPVRSLPGDFNKDGLRDWIVCGFGYTRGGLYLFQQQPDRTFEKKVIRGVPGAVDARVGDFNRDGWPDVMVLFAHGNEGIWLFINNRSGGFDSENLLRFPPLYGSTHFQLVDFNGDGALDILYTSGDNADYSAILKPYHGIYIFINQGDFQYEQSYFYHLNGATEAIAADFDDDGDLDIAAIAFFADLEDESAPNFVYLEQEGTLEFIPHAPPLQHYGQWLSMDAGDYDGDGDQDLVLGNYARDYLNRKSTEESSLPFIVLENESR